VAEDMLEKHFLTIDGLLLGDARMPSTVRFDGWVPHSLVAQFDQPVFSHDAVAVLRRAAAV